MAGFGHLFSNLTDQVFRHRHQPRIANVWNRAFSRTAHLFDKANINGKSHGVAKAEKEEQATAAVEEPKAVELSVDVVISGPESVEIASASVETDTATEETTVVGEEEIGDATDENTETTVDLVM
jgi:hypothetical protein